MMQKSPFKFLDSFTKEDREIFFGRDKEIEEIHSRVYESKILLVYGTSGTGKSSLINCGLANKFNDSDWLPVNIRRGTDVNKSLFDALSKNALTKAPFEKAGATGGSYNLERLLRSVYLDHFKPVFLIFDQFEELFIFGGKDEKNDLIRNVAKVFDSDLQCRLIFSMREEYLAGVTEFERVIPSFLSNRIRIEKMTRHNAIQTIEGPCRINNIEVEAGFADALLEKLNPDTPEVELTWLQIYLDKIMRLAGGDDHIVKRFFLDLIARAGEVKDILGSFLEEQISQLSDPDTALVVLKSFVSVKGTKNQITEEEVIEYSGTFGKKVDSETIKEFIQRFIRLRILRDKDENGRYELRHDSLASKIFEKITLVEKELLEVKYFIENAYVNYEKRHLLLSEEDLKYIAPYEDKLFLNEKNLRFIDQSKQALHKARRRRQNIAIAAASVIFVILSFFTIWAMKERSNAVKLRQIAVIQKDSALIAQKEAETARQEAVISRQKAEENEKLAINAMNQSETDRKVAIDARKIAEQQQTRAEQLSVLASEQARKAELEKQVADTQRILAQTAEEKANRLSMLSMAQTLALKAMSQELKPQAMGLVAVQAYNFNIKNGGAINDPVIFKALTKAYSILDSSKHSILTGPSYDMQSIAENENGLFFSDLDGSIYRLFQDIESVYYPDRTIYSYIDFVSLCPDGKKIIMNYGKNKLILTRITLKTPFNTEDLELQNHAKGVKTAAWRSDGKYLATGGKDSLIKIWETSLKQLNPIKTLKTPSSIRSLALCSEDSLISVHDNGSIILWDINNSTSKVLYSSETDQPLCVAWNGSKKTVMIGCSNGIIILIDLKNVPYHLSRFATHTAGIDHIVFSMDFTLMATAGWDKVVRLYNYYEFFEMSNSVGGAVTFNDVDARARSLMFTADKKLVAGMSDKTIRIWETSSEKLVSLICSLVKRDMTPGEWADIVGTEIPYEKTCNRIP
jgi:WD40 repeat protein/energy-coupling factor transporter ATP-binding protein EcfA2